jgi:hypothetical protein
MHLKNLFRSPPTNSDCLVASQSGYDSWREASDAVTDSYRHWTAAPRGERHLAYLTYLAALELEDYAASAYQRLVEQAKAPLPVPSQEERGEE